MMYGNKNSTAEAACPNRGVDEEGRIVCRSVPSGDNEVSSTLCRECPVRAVGCDHLRYTLQKVGSMPITVRYATGRVEILDDNPPRIAFLRAACSERVAPVASPRECLACLLHSARCAGGAEQAVVAGGVSGRRIATAATSAWPERPAGKVIQFPGRMAAAG